MPVIEDDESAVTVAAIMQNKRPVPRLEREKMAQLVQWHHISCLPCV